jgi:hypothetical protein
LLLNEPFVITVSEETLLLSQAIPTQRFTVITLPWKRLLQTRYNIFVGICMDVIHHLSRRRENGFKDVWEYAGEVLGCRGGDSAKAETVT